MLFLGGCSPVPIESYVADKPRFEPRTYFDGMLDAWGVVHDWRGKVTRRFSVEIDGTVSGDTIVLDERFEFNDGERSTRKWTIELSEDDGVIARADDVIGDASGKVVGNAMSLGYLIDLDVGDRQYRVRFDDMLWQIDDDVLFNRAVISKFGIKVGEVTLFMKRR